MSEDRVATGVAAPHSARFDAVTGPLGDAALVGTVWITGPTVLDRFPGTWDVGLDDPDTVRYTPPGDGSVTTGGVAIGGPFDVAAAGKGGAVLRHGPVLHATVLHWPGFGLAVRLWDASDVSVQSLAAIEVYPHDAAWRVEARYAPSRRTIDYEYLGHGGRVEGRDVVGDVELTIDGRDYSLLVTRGAGGLTIVFGDATNGHETYGGGRFVPVAEPADGRTVVDFNQATLPPCAFSPHFDCPLPPTRNVIRVPVRAGEKSIRRK